MVWIVCTFKYRTCITGGSIAILCSQTLLVIKKKRLKKKYIKPNITIVTIQDSFAQKILPLQLIMAMATFKNIFFLAFNFLSVLRGHSVFSSLPQQPMSSDFKGFSIPDFIHYIYFSYPNS